MYLVLSAFFRKHNSTTCSPYTIVPLSVSQNNMITFAYLKLRYSVTSVSNYRTWLSFTAIIRFILTLQTSF